MVMILPSFAKAGSLIPTNTSPTAEPLAELIPAVEELMATFGESTQRVLLRITLGMLLTPDHIAGFAFRLVNAGLIPRVQDYAQYAAFITRLSWCISAALPKNC
jgi:hypothetical protein